MAFTLVVAAMLLLANRSHALFTSYMIDASNALAAARATLTNNTLAERRASAALGLALRDLSRPSASVASDYSLFVLAALHLGPLSNEPEIITLGSNVFNAFTNEAQAEIISTADRIAALNDFVRTKRAASNQLAVALLTLTRLNSLDPNLQFLLARQIFSKLLVANRLAAIGELHPGFAADSLVGAVVHHTERGGVGGDVQFNNATDATETETGGSPEAITYTYTRTGLNTATLVLNEGTDGTTTVKLRFTSAGGGTFAFRHVDTDNSVQIGSGSFTLTF